MLNRATPPERANRLSPNFCVLLLPEETALAGVRTGSELVCVISFPTKTAQPKATGLSFPDIPALWYWPEGIRKGWDRAKTPAEEHVLTWLLCQPFFEFLSLVVMVKNLGHRLFRWRQVQVSTLANQYLMNLSTESSLRQPLRKP